MIWTARPPALPPASRPTPWAPSTLKTGAVGKVAVTGPVAPKGLIFVP
jgi:hypothetical protein